jgi:IS605 OrfB family transposase
MIRSNGVTTTTIVPVEESLMSDWEFRRLRQITNRDTRVIKRYLGIIEDSYPSIRAVSKKTGKISDKIDLSKLDTMTSRTQQRAQVKYDLKTQFPRISLNELKECRDTAVGMYHSYLELQKNSQKNAGKPRTNGKLIPRNIGYRRFKLDCEDNSVSIMDSMDTNPQMIKSGKTRAEHNWLKIPLKLSEYHLEQFDKGMVKSLIVHRENSYSIHFAIRREVAQLPKKREDLVKPIRVFGIDLGINKSANVIAIGPKGVCYEKSFIQLEKKKALEQLNHQIASLQKTKDIRHLITFKKSLKNRIYRLNEIEFNDTPLYDRLQLLSDKVSKLVNSGNISLLDEIEQVNIVVKQYLKLAVKTLFDYRNHTDEKCWKQVNILWKLQNTCKNVDHLRKNIDMKVEGILKKLRDLREQRNKLSIEYDHQMTREIVKYISQFLDRFEVFVAVGRLRGIRKISRRGNGNKAHRKRIHKWAFARVTAMLGYKSALIGLTNRFEVVDESWTSIMCWKCNTKGERPRQSYFICINPNCLWKGDADRNGAINIAKKLIHKFKLTNPFIRGVRGLGRYLPVVSRNNNRGARQSKNLPKARLIGARSPVRIPKGNGHAGAGQIIQTTLDDFDRYDPPVVKKHGNPVSNETSGKRSRTEARLRKQRGSCHSKEDRRRQARTAEHVLIKR